MHMLLMIPFKINVWYNKMIIKYINNNHKYQVTEW